MPSKVKFYSADIKFFIKFNKLKVSKKWKIIPKNGKANSLVCVFLEKHFLFDYLKFNIPECY